MKKDFFSLLKKTSVLGVFSVLLTSCGGMYVAGYGDGIYGEEPPAYSYQRQTDHYNPQPESTKTGYKSYYQQKASEYENFNNELNQPNYQNYTPMAKVDDYKTPENNSYRAGWGENPSRTSVNIYNYGGSYSPFYGGFYDPYYDWSYRHSYFWGSSLWSPYYGYYHRPYRSGWSITIGSGYPYYDYGYPNWGYGYYSGYYGRYYAPYYPYYGYGGDVYYGRRVYQNPRTIVHSNERRGDSNRYENYRQSRDTYQRNSPYNSGYYNRNGNQQVQQTQPQKSSGYGYYNRNQQSQSTESQSQQRTSGYGYQNRNSSGSYNQNTSGYYNSGSSNSGYGSQGSQSSGYRSSNRR